MKFLVNIFDTSEGWFMALALLWIFLSHQGWFPPTVNGVSPSILISMALGPILAKFGRPGAMPFQPMSGSGGAPAPGSSTL
ncbi:MAG: hypothetical protein A2W26_02835 [Acidobacteria bacterium RBG_16_64_8]|nr:MAG: hypothetical protein A2W26_02835 [Acidobacteria bacterium RBG_16_64_8]